MEYHGSYPVFDHTRITTYPLSKRQNKVTLTDLKTPDNIRVNNELLRDKNIIALAEAIKDAREKGRPVIWLYGAHIIKNGLGPILIDLARQGFVSLFATNGAGAIHDFELALIGQTSENVPNALNKGLFGMAEETGRFMNEALRCGNLQKIGAGEALGRTISGEPCPDEHDFPHTDVCVLAKSYSAKIPHTVHITLGTDIIHQHPAFDPEAVGGTSGRDFAVFAAMVEKMHEGGVFLNVSSAVTGPEVFLKSISMAANVGKPPMNIITGDFDMRKAFPENTADESAYSYYFRDYKSVVTRVPASFGGEGYYIQGNHMETLPALYQVLTGNNR